MKITLSLLVLLVGYLLYWFLSPPFDDSRDAFRDEGNKNAVATLGVAGGSITLQFEMGLSVAEAVRRAGFAVTTQDQFFPAADMTLLPGTRILWQPARTIRIAVDGEEKTLEAVQLSVEEIISAASITLDEDDIVVPAREETVSDDTEIVITRVEIKEEVKDTKIAFTTKSEEDDELSWREKIVTQKGENGIKRTTYRVSYHNAKEVNRKVLSTEIVKEPVTEVVTQGTYVKTGKSHRGAASWYAWTGTMAAANPWLPKGSYVRVTNLDNGKSVIVVINDRGPFVPGRIIDLDKVAFEKIASIGAGVINVKMEEIVN